MALFRRRPDRIRGIAGSLEGRTVLVADGCAGAAAGVVRVAAEAGAQTIMAAADHVAVDLQLRKLANTPGEVIGVATNSASGDRWDGLISAGERFPDAVVVNPATVTLKDRPAEEDAPAELGPHGAVELARFAAAGMRDRGLTGAIVYLIEIERFDPAAAASAYLQATMKQLAAEVASNGIRVNAIATGDVAVNRRDHVVSSRTAPLGHVSLHPVEIGKAAWFLINDDLSGGITGTVLKVDRGASLIRPEW
jgi:enoyl-[acyl-carrier-protein] reductase (NADH)